MAATVKTRVAMVKTRIPAVMTCAAALKTLAAAIKTRAATVRTRTVVLAAVALAFAGTGITSIALNSSSAATPSVAADPVSVLAGLQTPGLPSIASNTGDLSSTSDGSTASAAQSTTAVPPAPPANPEGSVGYAFELQPTYYYCGPAATRVALSAHGKVFTEDQLAGMLGTTTSGTPSAFDITRVLNEQLGQNSYRTVELSQRRVSDNQIAQLKSDIVTTISQGDTLVANVIGDGTDVTGHQRSYANGHYLNVVGYSGSGDVAQIADSADANAPQYQISVDGLAHWIGSRGYSASAN
jgi:hypothetical protein